MALNNKSKFKAEELSLADFAKALGHPARIAILLELAKRNECICGEIVEVLPLAQSTVSQHLQELKKAGLVKGTIRGVKSCYCINTDKFNQLVEEFSAFTAKVEAFQKENTCC